MGILCGCREGEKLWFLQKKGLQHANLCSATVMVHTMFWRKSPANRGLNCRLEFCERCDLMMVTSLLTVRTVLRPSAPAPARTTKVIRACQSMFKAVSECMNMWTCDHTSCRDMPIWSTDSNFKFQRDSDCKTWEKGNNENTVILLKKKTSGFALLSTLTWKWDRKFILLGCVSVQFCSVASYLRSAVPYLGHYQYWCTPQE